MQYLACSLWWNLTSARTWVFLSITQGSLFEVNEIKILTIFQASCQCVTSTLDAYGTHILLVKRYVFFYSVRGFVFCEDVVRFVEGEA